MTAESQPIDHAEAGFSWCEVGSGAPLLFLHPIVGTRRYWDAQLSEFSTTRRCIALDAPGYGESSMVGDPLASSVTGRLVAFLDHLGLERVDVVGLSLGGMHAMHFAVHAPERVGRLVLADTSAAFGIDPEPWLAEWLAPARSGTPMREIARNSIEAISHVVIPPATLSVHSAAFEQVTAAGFEQASRYIAEHNLRASLPMLKHDCLVIVGDHDDETPVEYSEELALLMPNASLEVLEGVGHLSSLEAPEVFNACVRAFLAKG